VYLLPNAAHCHIGDKHALGTISSPLIPVDGDLWWSPILFAKRATVQGLESSAVTESGSVA